MPAMPAMPAMLATLAIMPTAALAMVVALIEILVIMVADLVVAPIGVADCENYSSKPDGPDTSHAIWAHTSYWV